MWSEMNEFQREEYKDYFVTYHSGVAKTGKKYSVYRLKSVWLMIGLGKSRALLRTFGLRR